MCRLLAVNAESPVDINTYLEYFSRLSQVSKEYQGHGWGLAYLENTSRSWEIYKSINPIWKDTIPEFGKSSLFLVHARSAFEDEGISIENNMPFRNNDLVFIFNGELRGVKIREKGRIGAEKVFNFVQRFIKHDIYEAMDRAIPIIEDRTDYIRAMNFIISDKSKFYVSSYYNEDPDYFNLHLGIPDEDIETIIVSSVPFGDSISWTQLDNYSNLVI